MKKMALMTMSFIVCLYLAGCGSPDRNQQDREQTTAQAQAAGMVQENSEQKDGAQLVSENTFALQEKAQDAQTEWDGQEEDQDLQDTVERTEIREDWEEALGENYNPGYTVNEDGTYTYNGETFQYKILLDKNKSGRRYLVLTNNENLTFHDILRHWTSSRLEEIDGNGEYVILGTLQEDEEEGD